MQNSHFARHGIEHLSPSSLNLWLDSPGLWSIRYLARVRDETSPAAVRGSAVEAGLNFCLRGQKGALEAALQAFDQNMQGEVRDDIEAERELIAGMVEQCQKWTPPSKLAAAQIKVEHWFEGVSIPVIGYVDFAFEDAGDVDLKTTKACPSKPKADHARQIALYRAARKRPGGLLYVTPKRHEYFQLDDAAAERSLSELHGAAISLERFLSRFDDAEDAIRCLPMNRDSFRWSELATKKCDELHI
jgi:hypothetical protein